MICVGDVVLDWLLLLVLRCGGYGGEEGWMSSSDGSGDGCSIAYVCMALDVLFLLLLLIGILDDDDFRTVLYERGADGCDGGGGSWYMILEE